MADRRAIVPRTLPSSANSVRSTRSAAARQPPPSLLCNLCQKPLATTCFLCACDCIFCEGEWVRVGRATMRLFHWARLLLFCFDSFIYSLAGWFIGFFQSCFFEMNRPTVFNRQIKACFVININTHCFNTYPKHSFRMHLFTFWTVFTMSNMHKILVWKWFYRIGGCWCNKRHEWYCKNIAPNSLYKAIQVFTR